MDEVREGLAKPSPLPDAAAPSSSTRQPHRGTPPPLASDVAGRAAREAAGSELIAIRAAGLPDDLFHGAAEKGIKLAVSGMHALLATADLAFVASGTATLEAALSRRP